MAIDPDDFADVFDEKASPHPGSQKSNALTNKISTVLSQSFADSEIRDALQTLDSQEAKNSAEFRRGLWMKVQGEVIQRNSDIIQDFAPVANVGLHLPTCHSVLRLKSPAPGTHR